MKQLLLFFCVFSLSNSLSAQSIEIDHRLAAIYDYAYLEKLQNNHPKQLERMNFYLDHSYHIAPFEKEEITDLKVIEIDDIEQFNILLFLENEKDNIKRHYHKNQIFRIKGSNKALYLLSGKSSIKAFNTHWESLKG